MLHWVIQIFEMLMHFTYDIKKIIFVNVIINFIRKIIQISGSCQPNSGRYTFSKIQIFAWKRISLLTSSFLNGFFLNHMFIFLDKFKWLVNHNLCVSNCCKKKWFLVINVASSAHQYKNCIMALHSGNKCALEHRKDIGLCHTSLHNVF